LSKAAEALKTGVVGLAITSVTGTVWVPADELNRSCPL